MPTDGGEARRITAAVGGVGSFVWSPDGDRIAFTQRVTAQERSEALDTDENEDTDDDDFRVPVNNAELLHLCYRKLGVETRLVRYPREGHELSRSGEPVHVVDRLERIDRWFDGYFDHHDVPKALERGDEGLSAGEKEQ